MLTVENSTRTEKRKVQIGSASFHSGYKIIHHITARPDAAPYPSYEHPTSSKVTLHQDSQRLDYILPYYSHYLVPPDVIAVV